MKFKKMTAALAVSAVLTTGLSPIAVSADTLSEITSEEKSTQAELNNLEEKVSSALNKVNTLNKQITDLEADIAESKETITSTEADITATEEELIKRMDQAKDRLRTIQVNEVNESLIYMLLNSESISDIFNRFQLISTLFEAGNSEIDEAEETHNELVVLKDALTAEKETLENNKNQMIAQKASFDKEVASLRQLINENQTTLALLNKRRQTEETRIAKVAARKAAEEEKQKAQMAQAAKQSKEKAVETPKVQKLAAKPVVQKSPVESAAPKPEKPAEPSTNQSSSGREVTVVASAYSTNQPSLSSHTATGINLNSNPNVIAVDPNVIPLGSLVEVPGYGIRIAGDTGGAIKGNRIDIHITNLSTAHAFGYQTMTVRVLN